MLKGSLIKTTLVDYPTRVAATYFLSGCNIRCPYCYNIDLVLNTLPDNESSTIDDVYHHLERRRSVLSGFVLSGGEPLVHDEVGTIIKKVKDLGYKVKLDTNGLSPKKLEILFNNPATCPDYVAIDIKTSPEKYNLLHYTGNAKITLMQSIEIVKDLPPTNREFRSVLCPPLVGLHDIQAMAEILPLDSPWYFATFRNENCLDQDYNLITPYSDIEYAKIVEVAKKIIPGALLR